MKKALSVLLVSFMALFATLACAGSAREDSCRAPAVFGRCSALDHGDS
jgi:hypothetical protein